MPVYSISYKNKKNRACTRFVKAPTVQEAIQTVFPSYVDKKPRLGDNTLYGVLNYDHKGQIIQVYEL